MKIICGRRGSTNLVALPALLIGVCIASLPAAAQQCDVKIGVTGPMTGNGAAYGLSEKGATDFVATTVNAGGGLQMGDHKCKVTIVTVDAQGTVSGGAAAANALASAGVHAVNGPINSTELAGFRPAAQRNGIVFFSTAFKADAVSREFPLGFHALQAPPTWGHFVAQAVKDHFQAKTAVVLGTNDQAGTDAGNATVAVYNEVGIKATIEFYQRGTTNFAPIALRLINMNPDLIEVGPIPPGDAALLGKQLLETGYAGAIGKMGAGVEPMIKDLGGIKELKAFYWFDHIPTQDPGAQKMKADYERVMKTSAPELSLWYTHEIAAEVLLSAISAAGTDQDGDKIAAALRNLTPESRYMGKAGWRGMKQYGLNQEFSFPVALNFVVDGKVEPQIRIDIPAEPQN